MFEINRSLIILRHKQPFVDWARALDDQAKDLTLEELSEDSTAYLVPEIWDELDEQTLVESYYDILFEEQLNAWSTDNGAWPKERDLRMFRDWFEVEFHSLVLDLFDEPIASDDADNP